MSLQFDSVSFSSTYVDEKTPHSYSNNIDFVRDLSFNNLTGDLPSSFGSLLNLTSLYVSRNFICNLLCERRCNLIMVLLM